MARHPFEGVPDRRIAAYLAVDGILYEEARELGHFCLRQDSDEVYLVDFGEFDAGVVDFTNPDLIQAGLPLPEFAYLRQNRPLYWNPQTREETSYDDGGFWMATRWEDVRNISSARDGWSRGRCGPLSTGSCPNWPGLSCM